MSLFEKKIAPISKLPKSLHHGHRPHKAFDVQKSTYNASISPTSTPVSVSAHSPQRSPASEHIKENRSKAETLAEEQLSHLALTLTSLASESPSTPEQQLSLTLTSSVDQSQPDGASCDSGSASTRVASGTVESANHGVNWKDVCAKSSHLGAEDAEDIPLDGVRGLEVGEKAADSENARGALPQRSDGGKQRGTSATVQKGAVGFRWSQKQRVKQQEDHRDKEKSVSKKGGKLVSSKPSRKDSSPEGIFLNAVAKGKLMFLPMKDWEDERKARSTVVSRLLAQLTSALASISTESNVSTACMLKLLQARSKATFDYTRSLQQNCTILSRRFRRAPDAGVCDSHNSSFAGRVAPPSAVRATGAGLVVPRYALDSDSPCCSSILFTSPVEDSSTALDIKPGLSRSLRDADRTDTRHFVGSAASDAACVALGSTGWSQHAGRVKTFVANTGKQKGSGAPLRTLSASGRQSQHDVDCVSNLCATENTGDQSNRKNNGARSSSAGHELLRKTPSRKTATDAYTKAETRKGAVMDLQRSSTGRNGKACSFDFSRKYLSGKSLSSRPFDDNDRGLCKSGEKGLQRDAGKMTSSRLKRNTTLKSGKRLKEQKTRRSDTADSVAEAATVTPGTALFSRLSMKPWVLLLLKMTHRSSLDVEALEFSEEHNLLQESLRVIRLDYERAATAQLNAVRKRALEAGTAHQSCCVAWNVYEQTFEDSARLAGSSRGMSLQLPPHHTQQPANRATSVLGLSTSSSIAGNPRSCTWLSERKYVIAAKKAQEQELEHVREVLRAVLVLENLERWRYDTLRENIGKFFWRIRQCLTTLCGAVDFYLFDVLGASTTLRGGDTSGSSLKFGSQVVISDSFLSESSTLCLEQQQSEVSPRWWTSSRGQQREDEEDDDQPFHRQTYRISRLCRTNTGKERDLAWAKHLRSLAREQPYSKSSTPAPTRGPVSCARHTAAVTLDAPPTTTRTASGVLDLLLRRAQAEESKQTSKRLERKTKQQKQRPLHHAQSAGLEDRCRGFRTAVAPRLVSRSASSPILGGSSAGVATSVASALPAVAAASSLQRRESAVCSSSAGTSTFRAPAKISNSLAQARESISKSAALCSSSSAAILAEEEDREEAMMAAALSSAAAADEESSSEGTDSRETGDRPPTLLQQRFPIERASDLRGAQSRSEEREAGDWQDEHSSDAAESADEETGRRFPDAEPDETEGEPGQAVNTEGLEKEEEEQTDEKSEDIPALQSIPSKSSVAFSPAAAYVDLWWLLRRCELLPETGGKVPACLCNSVIVKIAKHLRYAAIPASSTLLKSGKVQRLSSAAPPFSRSTERWKEGFLLLTWDRFLFMFRDEESAMSGEPSFLWTAFLPGAEIRKVKSTQAEPATVEVRETKRRFSLRRTSVSFRPLTEQACNEWLTTLQGVAMDSVFFSAAATRGGVSCLFFEKPTSGASECRQDASPVLHPEVLSDSVAASAGPSDVPSGSVSPLAGPDALTLPAHIPTVSLPPTTRHVWYDNSRKGGDASYPLSALMSIDESVSSAESDIRSFSQTLESGVQRSESIDGSKTDEGVLHDGARRSDLPVVGPVGLPLNSTASPIVKVSEAPTAGTSTAAVIAAVSGEAAAAVAHV